MRSKHFKMSLFFTIAAILAVSPSYGETIKCEAVFAEKIQTLQDWRPTPGTTFMGFRSNAPHFWSWLKNEKNSLLNFRGVVSGDPHIMNFGDITVKSKEIKWSFIDSDDAGVSTPFIGDLVRLMVGIKLSPYAAKETEILMAYKSGLNLEKISKPEILKNLESESWSDTNIRQKKFISKLVNNDKFSEKADLLPIEISPKEILTIYNQSVPYFEKSLAEYTILDRGYKTKSTGGSQGLPRFWFLVIKNNEHRVLEFKLKTASAVESYNKQPDSSAVFNEFLKYFRPIEEATGEFKIIDTGVYNFLLRERIPHLLDLDPMKIKTNLDVINGQEVSVYLANRLGMAHGKQQDGPLLVQALKEKSTDNEIIKMVNDYLKTIPQQ